MCNAHALRLPNSIRVIGEAAFSISSFREITIPEGVRELPEGAFEYAFFLESIHLPASLQSFPRPGRSLSALQHMDFAPGSPFSSPDGKCLLTNGGKTFLWLLDNVSGSYRVPDGVAEIPEEAFADYSELTEVILPDSVSKVGKGAFQYCRKLQKLHLSDAIETIEKNTCYGCSSLQDVHFPAALRNIMDYAFFGTALLRADLPERVEIIRPGAFVSDALEEVVIPSALQSIGHAAFQYSHLKRLVYRPEDPFGIACAACIKNKMVIDLPQIDEIVLEKVPLSALTDLPNSLLAPICRGYIRRLGPENPPSEELRKTIGKLAHRAKWDCWADPEICPFLMQYTLLQPADYIEAMAGLLLPKTVPIKPPLDQLLEYYKRFPASRISKADENYRLTGPSWLNDAEDVPLAYARRRFTWRAQKDGTLMITGYKGIETDVVIPTSIDGTLVTAIGDEAFSAKDKTISEWQREMRRKISNILCPNSVVWIGNRAFWGCTRLISIYINEYEPYHLRWLGVGAFRDCSAYDGDLPYSLDTIHQGCFSGCRSIKKVYVPGAVGRIDSRTFNGCTKLEEATLYEGITEVDDLAFEGCTNLKILHLPKSLQITRWKPFADCPVEHVYAPKGSKAAKLAEAQGIRVTP